MELEGGGEKMVKIRRNEEKVHESLVFDLHSCNLHEYRRVFFRKLKLVYLYRYGAYVGIASA